MVQVKEKQEPKSAEVVGKVSLKNDGVFQELWLVKNHDNSYAYIPEEVFVQKYDIVDMEKDVESLLKEKSLLEAELAVKEEEINNLKAEYRRLLEIGKLADDEMLELKTLVKQTFKALKQDFSAIETTVRENSIATNNFSKFIERLEERASKL